jgi:transposase
MPPTLPASRPALTRLMKRDPDPRVRRRAHALLLVAEGQPLVRGAHLFQTAPPRIRAWRAQFLTRGRAGLAAAPRPGRPPKLSPAVRTFLVEVLARSPQDYGFLSTVWSVRDPGLLRAHRYGLQVCTATVYRALLSLGYRHRRPRHDLRHRQDPQAVAAARHVLEWLKKSAPQVLEGFDWSTWTGAKSTSIPGWRRSGKSVANPCGSLRRAPTAHV